MSSLLHHSAFRRLSRPVAGQGRICPPPLLCFLLCLGMIMMVCTGNLAAEETSVSFFQASGGQPVQFSVTLDGMGSDQQDIGVAIQLVLLMTMLTLGPSLIVLMTSFTRIVIVLGFVRTAMGVHQAPSNQIIIGLALVLTFFIMQPVFHQIHDVGIAPYLNKEKPSLEALADGAVPLRNFMLRQTRPSDIEFFLDLSGAGPTHVDDLPLRVVMPAFVMSELRHAFQMGLLIFLPFIIIDFLVAATLMSMGMMMMPPVIVSLPFKILLFVMVDGWSLIVRSLVQSFHL